jgi:transposase
MFRFDADLRVWLHREAIDFRLGMNGLITLVEQSMQLDPFARAVFAFTNRRHNRVKLLLYERNGFWLMVRRLEQDRFVWPVRHSRRSWSWAPNSCTGCLRASTSRRCTDTRCVSTDMRARRAARL